MGFLQSEERCASTWYSFLSTDAKRTSSAVPHKSSNEGELRGKNPNLCNLNMKFCNRCLWPISAYPHHAGDACNILCGSAGDNVPTGFPSKTV